METKILVEKIVFDDEITLWWRKEAFAFADGYRLYLDGASVGKTDKTHWSFEGLAAARSYAMVKALLERY